MQDDKTPQAGWVFTPGGELPNPSSEAPNENHSVPEAPKQNKRTRNSEAVVSWSASEFIANPKNAGWFGLLAIGCLVLAAIMYFVTKDEVGAIVIVLLGVIVGIFAARQPRVLEYHIDEGGIQVGQKFYAYPDFKSFSVVEEGAFAHISLAPLKRFMPPLAIHFAPDDEEKIINTLADYLPYEEHKTDMVESVTRRLRF